jgi:hypothetical protein
VACAHGLVHWRLRNIQDNRNTTIVALALFRRSDIIPFLLELPCGHLSIGLLSRFSLEKCFADVAGVRNAGVRNAGVRNG